MIDLLFVLGGILIGSRIWHRFVEHEPRAVRLQLPGVAREHVQPLEAWPRSPRPDGASMPIRLPTAGPGTPRKG